MIDLLTLAHDKQLADLGGDVHAERRYDQASSTVIMWCGLIVSLLDNGDVDPPGADFYIEPWGMNATCAACLEKRGAP